jgi:ElaB/YqjD/DUF883 family membrane-anchored ribosome-binding protein
LRFLVIHGSFCVVKIYQHFTRTIMNDPYPTNVGSLDPQSGFAPAPSVSQAAHDLRVAAEEKIKDLAGQAGALKDKAFESATHLRDQATEKAREARALATEKAIALKTSATEKAAHFREVAQEQWTDTRARAREVHTSAEDYIREHPTKCVLGALGIGFLIGLIARR